VLGEGVTPGVGVDDGVGVGAGSEGAGDGAKVMLTPGAGVKISLGTLSSV